MPSRPSFVLPVVGPFCWDSLLAFLRLRATPGVETVTDTAYTRTIFVDASPQTLSVSFDRPASSLQVVCSGGASTREIAKTRTRQIFKTDTDTKPIETFLSADTQLAPFVSLHPGLRVPGGWSAFEVAVRAVLGQQVSVPAATTLMGRLVRLCGARLSEPAWLFPTPGDVIKTKLTGMGMPGSRLETVKSLAAFFAENGDDCLDQPNVKDRLLALKGIGKWTAGYILMRTSGSHGPMSQDHWPEGDLVLRKALSKTRTKTKTLITSAELEQTFSRWSPYRSYATIHIWRSYAGSKSSNAPDEHRKP
jgi:3-methyladenine DNA glycosylase/8-oxoguanine DNA glycosylase